MDEEKECYIKMSPIEETMYDSVGHFVHIKLKNGTELKREWSCCYESATDADLDYAVVYIMNDEGSGYGFTEDQIEEISIVD